MMSRRSFACLAAALAIATLLLATDPASAQRWRRGFYAGYYPWTGYSVVYGSPYYGVYGPWDYSYGWGYYPAYSGTWWNTPSYRWSGGQYSWSAPSYYGEGMAGDYYSSGGRLGYGGAYGATAGAGMDNTALISVRVPPNAEIWFDDQKTSQTGSFRSFISPPLDSDSDFVYHIRARWTEDGRQIDRARRIDVQAGDRLFVNLVNPRSLGMRGMSPGQYGTPGFYGAEPGTREDRTLENRDRNREEKPERAPAPRTEKVPGTQPSTKTDKSQLPEKP